MKKIACIIISIIIIVIVFFIYSNIAKASNDEAELKEKVLSEVQYFESKIVYMFNSLNNIEFENYAISTQDITEKAKKASQSSSSAGSGKGDATGEENPNSAESSNDKIKKYSFESKGVLNSDGEINWGYIKKEAEILQSSIATMILDLYEIGVVGNDVLSFNKEYDKLLIQIKNEDKENTLIELNKLYYYMPVFISKCDIDEQYKIVIITKLNVLNAYSILDTEKWEEIGYYTNAAIDEFSRLLTDINLKSRNQYITNKSYILLNGLQNAVETGDKEIFLIKYRDILEELNNM